jgi:hypothetical protein
MRYPVSGVEQRVGKPDSTATYKNLINTNQYRTSKVYYIRSTYGMSPHGNGNTGRCSNDSLWFRYFPLISFNMARFKATV